MPFHHIRLRREIDRCPDVALATRSTLEACGVGLPPGASVAIAVGSRGIRDLAEVVAVVARWVRAQGAEPFLVPAMGSHGGATAEGQQAVLEAYGLGGLGIEIRATMAVVDLDRGGLEVPVVFDAVAAAADATIVVNRIKPHTDFHGRYESGLMKMIAIGLGKRVQAEALHAYGTEGLRELMPKVAARVLEEANVVLGIAVVENARDETLRVDAMAASLIPEREAELLDIARAHLPRLPVDDLDVLLVDRMGKDVSGVGMDTNVIGRIMIAGEPEPVTPRIAMIGCHELTPASHGNACGMGLADVVPRRFADSIDAEVTRTNIVTSGFLLRGKLPVVADDDRHVWELCLRGAGVRDVATVRAARIVDTLHCEELWVSDAVLAGLASRTDVDVVATYADLHLADGRLRPFDPQG